MKRHLPSHTSAAAPAAGSASFLAGVGEMDARIRAFDWSATPLGPMETWSPALRMMTSFLLANRFPLLLWWGPDFIQIYNDAYRPILGAKHPSPGLGRSVRECWSEIWHILRPLVETPFNGGPATWMEDIVLEINRYGFTEETHFTIAYSPVPDETAAGGIGGVLATVHEITEKVVGERRLGLLRNLGASTEGKSAAEACAIAAATMSQSKDVPFALLYLIDADRKQAQLAAACGIASGADASPSIIELETEAPRHAWPLKNVLATEQLEVVENLAEKFQNIPHGPWSEPPHSAAVLPIRSNISRQPAGFLVAGLSPRSSFDENYRSFVDLVATQIATAVANARAYEEERKRAEQLAELDRAKTAFFSNVSHEFRTPLTLMIGPLEDALANAHGVLPLGASKELAVAHRNSLRLLKLVNTLLDFSRIEAGRIEANYEPTDLAAYTAELASVFRSAIEKAEMRLVVDCPSLPEPVFVDRAMWEKIVLNLLSNSFKFTFAGEIKVELRWCGERVELCVSDSGVGIPADQLSKVFERFHRVRGAKSRTHEGTGIGLALVQELARLHGGEVTAESEKGRGSKFVVSVQTGKSHLPSERIRDRGDEGLSAAATPFVEEVLGWLPEGEGAAEGAFTSSDAAVPEASRGVPLTGTRETPAPARILLADDNADMRNYVRRLLAQHYEVVSVGDGEAALKSIRAQRPDLVLTDVMMPRVDGFALLRQLRSDEQTRTIPVIMLSARAGEEARVQGLGAGADDYLIKPFSARELLARVQSQLELAKLRREGAERVTRILESITDGFHVVDAEGRFTEFNSAARAIYAEHGLNVDELINRRVLDVFPDAHDLTVIRTLAESVPTSAENFYAPWQRWFSVRRYPMPDNGVATFFADITERKRAEETSRETGAWLRGQKEAFQAAMDGAPLPASLGVLIRTAVEHFHGKARAGFYLVNDDAATLSHIVGMPDIYAQRVEGFKIGPDSLACGLAAHRGEPVITPDVTRDPSWLQWLWLAREQDYCACWSFPIRTSDGPVLGTLALYFSEPRQPTSRDLEFAGVLTHSAAIIVSRNKEVSERKRAEAEREAALVRAEAASRAKDDFLAALSHELRNPLNPVLLTAGEMARDPALPAEAREQLAMIQRNIALEARLIDDLLDLTRISRGLLHLEPAPTDAHVLLRHVEEIVQGDAAAAGVEMSFALETAEHHVLADPARLQQVFWNLIKNAIKFSAGVGRVNVRTFNPAPGRLAIAVADTGIGIAAEALARIFKPFEQGELGGQHRFGGLGLGLAISNAIVDLHHGELRAESPGPGNGATFTVELATTPAPAPSAPAPPTARLGPAALRLLVVEDHAETLAVLTRLLERDGHHVQAAGTIEEALALAAASECDLVVSDLGLPDGSGLELMRTLRDRHGWRGIALSGYGTDEDVHAARAVGFVAHLVKPVDMEELRRTVRVATELDTRQRADGFRIEP